MNKCMKAKLIIMTLCILATEAVCAQSFTVNKKFHGSYPAAANSEVSIDNKYGNVSIIPSDGDSVVFDVVIEVTDKYIVEAQEQLAEINVRMGASGYYIYSATEFNGNRNDFKTDWKMMTGAVFSSKKTVRIDYVVQVPTGVSLKINNSYGNLIMLDHSGILNIDLTGGNLTAGVLSGKTTITLNGGKSQIRALTDATIKTDMNEMQIESVSSAYFDSRGSQFTIQKAGTITVDSRRDKWFIGNATQISGSGSFSNFTISRLMKDCNMKTFYGNLTLSAVDSSFHSINLIAGSSDVSIALPPGVVPQFNCDQKKTRAILPARLNLKTETIDEKTQQYRTTNVVENATSFVNLNVSGGSVSVY